MKTLIIKTRHGQITIEMDDNDCPIQTMKDNGIKITTKYQLL